MNKLAIIFLALAIFQLNGIDAFDKIKLEDIKVIDLYRGRQTTGFNPVAQLRCANDFAGLCKFYAPSHVQCRNVGYSNGSNGSNGLVWRCSAQLASRIAFNQLQISCEAWPNSHKSGYVVQGSCSLSFNLRKV